MAEMKAEGIEYDERIERLDEVEHPKPGKEFIYATYNEFVLNNPWAKETSVRPKCIAREMFENWQSFEDYVKVYGLERSEAVLLRHLSEVFKVLVQTVPPAAKTEEVLEAESYFESMLRGIDSSLLDEWERLRDPDYVPEVSGAEAPPKKIPITRNREAFQRLVRAKVFDVVKALSRREWEKALSIPGQSDEAMTSAELGSLMSDYFEGHGPIRLDPEARNRKHCRIQDGRDPLLWKVEQALVDQEELNDWSIRFEVDLRASDEQDEVVLLWNTFGPVSDLSY